MIFSNITVKTEFAGVPTEYFCIELTLVPENKNHFTKSRFFKNKSK